MYNTRQKKLAVLVSGSGSNLQSLQDSIKSGEINGKILCVISTNYDAFALTRAKNEGIETFVCPLKDFESHIDRDKEILRILNSFEVDYVIFAGYLGIVTSVLCDGYKNRIINIHPSLLPKFGGKGFFGLHVHRAVIESGEVKSGATVHFVDVGVDTGIIIAQESVDVLPSDTAETLQKRILDNVEHKLLCRVVKALCEDRVQILNGKAIID